MVFGCGMALIPTAATGWRLWFDRRETTAPDSRRPSCCRPSWAEQSLASGSPATNPVVPTVDEIQDLHAQIYA